MDLFLAHYNTLSTTRNPLQLPATTCHAIVHLQPPIPENPYIFSGTLILNIVSTLKITFFTPMQSARRAC